MEGLILSCLAPVMESDRREVLSLAAGSCGACEPMIRPVPGNDFPAVSSGGFRRTVRMLTAGRPGAAFLKFA